MIKAKIHAHLVSLLNERIKLLQETIASAKESRDSETKSSVGDKYETGRTLMQQEVEKNRVQLIKTEQTKVELEQINLNQAHTKVAFGSLVSDGTNYYFISTALGKITIEGQSFFCISLASPIGKALHNKKVGAEIPFMGKTIEIKSIE